MTREVFIHNAKWFKTSLSTADMIGESNYEVAYLDEHMRRTVLKSDSRSTKLFDKDCIGRGVQLVEENRKTIHLPGLLLYGMLPAYLLMMPRFPYLKQTSGWRRILR